MHTQIQRKQDPWQWSAPALHVKVSLWIAAGCPFDSGSGPWEVLFKLFFSPEIVLDVYWFNWR
jgi:hypothetical protein